MGLASTGLCKGAEPGKKLRGAIYETCFGGISNYLCNPVVR